jgi:hypothetical protein
MEDPCGVFGAWNLTTVLTMVKIREIAHLGKVEEFKLNQYPAGFWAHSAWRPGFRGLGGQPVQGVVDPFKKFRVRIEILGSLTQKLGNMVCGV